MCKKNKNNYQQLLKTILFLLTKSNKGHSSTCKIVLDKLMQLKNVCKGTIG